MEAVLSMKPIGFMRSVFESKNGTPRQSGLCSTARGSLTVEKSVFNNPHHSLEGLEHFSHVWLIFVFHKNNNAHSKAKVRPPRLDGRRTGVFSTRSPYRPNPIGLTLARLDAVQGATLHLSGIDVIDGTPVLDIKPYIPYCDTATVIQQCEGRSLQSINSQDISTTLDYSRDAKDDGLTLCQDHSGTLDCSSTLNHSNTEDHSTLDKIGSSSHSLVKDHSPTLGQDHSSPLDNRGTSNHSPMKDHNPTLGQDHSRTFDCRGTLNHSLTEDHSVTSSEDETLNCSGTMDRRLTVDHVLTLDHNCTSDNNHTVEQSCTLDHSDTLDNISTSDHGHTTDQSCTLNHSHIISDSHTSEHCTVDPSHTSDNRQITNHGHSLDTSGSSVHNGTIDHNIISNNSIQRTVSDTPPVSELDTSSPSQDPPNPSAQITTADWIRDPLVSKLKVQFTNFAMQQLGKFSCTASDRQFRLVHLHDREELVSAIEGVLREDPRSVYRRQHCVDSLYYFTVDVAHVTCWFDYCTAQVVRVQPKSLVPQCS